MANLKEIPGFPNYYAGDDGHIYSAKRKGGNERKAGVTGPPRMLSENRDRRGYWHVNLDDHGRVVGGLVHRLVLLAFKGPPPEGYQGCHYPDTNTSNNRPENLRWDTQLENARDRHRNKPRTGPKRCTVCKEEKPRTEFYHDKRAYDGLHTACRQCHMRVSMASRDPEKRRKANREWMRAHYRPRKKQSG